MPATPKSTNNRNVAARMILVVVTHSKADARITTARMINMIVLPITRYFVLVLNLPTSHAAPPFCRLGSEPP